MTIDSLPREQPFSEEATVEILPIVTRRNLGSLLVLFLGILEVYETHP